MKQNNYQYCNSLTVYSRRKSCEVAIGNVRIGANNPIMIQSMATVDTNLHNEAVQQAKRIFDAGALAVRFTAQGVREAKSLGVIRELLTKQGIVLPLIADIHFNPKAAFEAACNVEKVRINPGNFVDRKSNGTEYSDAEYDQELERLQHKFSEFIALCRKRSVAIRVGVNHGSLSDRIMSRYGDTPQGMVQSAMEMLRVCKLECFDNVVVSMKSSNTITMVTAYRMICEAMNNESMNYPLHLGVTEAGEGSDGRVRSAVGIGALLNDGIGDTIRVSLTEQPENEVPVAQMLVSHYEGRVVDVDAHCVDFSKYNPYQTNRHKSQPTFVVFDLSYGIEDIAQYLLTYPDDYLYIGARDCNVVSDRIIRYGDSRLVLVTPDMLSTLSLDRDKIAVVEVSSTQAARTVALHINSLGLTNMVVLRVSYDGLDYEAVQLFASADLGGLLIDGFGDGVWISSPSVVKSDALPLQILQASRRRFSRVEYISCPGCGRTLYDLQNVVRQVKERTAELKNIKIAVMGCIVNGPGEMADADYGYVGASRGLVTLYKQKEVVEANIPQHKAIDRLVELIKREGDWR